MIDTEAVRALADDMIMNFQALNYNATAALKLRQCADEIDRLNAENAAQNEELVRTWFVLKDFGHHPGRTDDKLSDCVRAMYQTQCSIIDELEERLGMLSGEGDFLSRCENERDAQHKDGCGDHDRVPR